MFVAFMLCIAVGTIHSHLIEVRSKLDTIIKKLEDK